MPLRLKSLELHGYKTFASRTGFEFPGMITAIVGPNGSGKSNVTDGLRWVLGEQSYSLLRGKKTEDMIFTGSDQRPRAGMAACTIIFDNSDNWLPIDYSEVAITRRAYRDGQNEYLLNGQRVRLKDISELLAQSGLSERTYSIIGQGLIDNSLALRPEERRKIFEEAAGIGLYRGRRNESLNRLEVTRRNMERVKDILAELEPRITILEKQAKKAQDHERIKADLQLVLREWYGYHWYKGQEDITESKENLKKQELHLEQVKNKHNEINQKMVSLRIDIQKLREELNNWHSQASNLHIEKEVISKDIAVREERLRSLTDQLHTYELEITRLEEEIRSNNISLDEIVAEKQEILTDLDSSLVRENELKSEMEIVQQQRAKIETKIRDIRNNVSVLETRNIKSKAAMEEKQVRRETLLKSFSDMSNSLRDLESNLSIVEGSIKKASENKLNIEKQLSDADEYLAKKNKESEFATIEINLLKKEKAAFEQVVSKLQMEIDLFEKAENDLVGYPSGAKSLLQSIRKGDLSGFANALSSNLVVSEDLELAISVALGEYADAIMLQKNVDPDQALSLLEIEQNGRTAIIPQSWIKHKSKINKPDHKDCIGVAIDLVQYPPEYKVFYELLLSRALIVKSRLCVKNLISEIPEDAIIITLSGEMFFPDGRILGGRNNKSAHISRPRQIKDLREKLEREYPKLEQVSRLIDEKQDHLNLLNSKITEKNDEKHEIEIERGKANSEYQSSLIQFEKIKRQLEWNTAQQEQITLEKVNIEKELTEHSLNIDDSLSELNKYNKELKKYTLELNDLSIDSLRRDLNYLQTNIAVNQRALNEYTKRINEKNDLIKVSSISVTAIRTKLDDSKRVISDIENEKLDNRTSESEKNTLLEKLQAKIGPAEERLKELDNQYSDLLEIEENSQQIVNNAEKYFTQAQMDHLRKKENIEMLRRRIEEDFGLVAFDYAEDVSGPTPLPIEGMVEQLPVIKEITPELEENITRQKSLLRRLGAVNPEAKEEYESTKERFDFLTQQINDLLLAEENIKHILSDLDTLMKSEFQKTFTAVSEEFPKMFNKLFGGGSARLVLSDPDDLHESGIEIHARLPGKREQELTLLSGGERSLTAVALIFGLLKVSPTPFCVLDEVDAMLDESNVGRFRDLLLELSQQIQFILVTHNRNTVQAANVIYGITMGKDSTSQMVSLRLDEVPDEILSKSR